VHRDGRDQHADEPISSRFRIRRRCAAAFRAPALDDLLAAVRRKPAIGFQDGFVQDSATQYFLSGIVGIASRDTSFDQRGSETSEVMMLYAILAYHMESDVMSWTPEEDEAVMTRLRAVQEPLKAKGHFGPAARLGETRKARTLRGPGAGMVLDGPFAETKEQLLGFYIMDFADEDGAIAAARELRKANPSAVYEIRPIKLFLPADGFGATPADG
jgi:hypothetical protein